MRAVFLLFMQYMKTMNWNYMIQNAMVGSAATRNTSEQNKNQKVEVWFR